MIDRANFSDKVVITAEEIWVIDSKGKRLRRLKKSKIILDSDTEAHLRDDGRPLKKIDGVWCYQVKVKSKASVGMKILTGRRT